MNIVVYCGSRFGNDKKYQEIAYELGKYIALNKHTLVYGGSNCGIMGEIATSCLKHNGKVIGVRPHCFHEGDILDTCTEIIYTDSMNQRKAKMIELGDFFIAFPGGTGTLDEISEVMVERSIEDIDKTYVYLNIDGFYDTLYKFFKELNEKDFVTDKQLSQILMVNNLDELKDVINNLIF